MSNLPWKRIGLVLALTVFAGLFLFYNPVPDRPEVGKMAAIAAFMAILWITEAIPLAATALMPIVLFPLAGILDSGSIAKDYVNSIIFLFIGGFLIALSMERWNLHRRIALNIIYVIGRRADLLILGFMVACGFLSMWISNTATAVMMLPVGLAVVSKMEEEFGKERSHPLTLALMLGIAYGCTIGGVSTLVGTPPNLAFIRIIQELFPEAPPITFGNWIIMGVPYSIVLLLTTWFLLTHVLCRFDKSLRLDRSIIRSELKQLGPMRFEEKAVLVVFACTVFLWTFRRDLDLGIFTLPGWSSLWAGFDRIDDGTIAIAMALVLFLVPARQREKANRILDTDVFGRLPWGIILLFGGGFALASGFASSGLSLHIGESFRALGNIPIPILLLVICLSVTFLTELTSNVATITMLLPILVSWAASMGVHPLLFAIPATISASMAFMMPVATPPNAVVFGSQRIRIIEMARTGIVLNLFAVGLTLLAVYIFFPAVTGAAFGDFPSWAK
ncbi:SLC13/DASS family transporter [Puniceicoccales bacterium CK1056]|uniref:SLC13/DASS family transporter n=1 Tax=Oceanipulchritudo coccoides TaxID=2706888 RepID=A0A6B2M238_9BACT|nr:SLC13 family permease [Oceanipulchritudo coccoides]NDV62204.1 SLC13/DASS family transporter [Oceanipulchritudo coccoides]